MEHTKLFSDDHLLGFLAVPPPSSSICKVLLLFDKELISCWIIKQHPSAKSVLYNSLYLPSPPVRRGHSKFPCPERPKIIGLPPWDILQSRQPSMNSAVKLPLASPGTLLVFFPGSANSPSSSLHPARCMSIHSFLTLSRTKSPAARASSAES